MDRHSHLNPPTAPALVGRERELAMLRDALAAALTGRGALVLIGGEAGIGKTALAEATLAEASEQGALVLIGRCYDLSETPPYGPWIDLFARYLPAGDDPPPPPAFARRGTVGAVTSQAELCDQVRDFLAALAAPPAAAGTRPVVILLDDLHWADPAAVDLLRFLARGLAGLPILTLVTYRSDELTRRHPLHALLPALVRESGAIRLDLRPLEDADLRTLLRHRYALPADDEGRLANHLHAHAEGNPLYIGELLRALEEARTLAPGHDSWHLGDHSGTRVPTLLRQVIEARLSRLGAESEHLLSLAAVIGQVVPFSVWAMVAATDEATLLATVERASGARIADETTDGTGMRFTHALIRETLYEGLTPSRRRAIHRQVGEALAAGPLPDPDTVASHFQRAGDPRAFAWLVRAGLRAHLAAAWLTAAERFAAAAALPDDDGTRARARGWLLFCCARLLSFSDNARSLRASDEAESYALAAGDRALAALVRFGRGRVRCLGGDIRQGLAEMERQIADLDALPGEYHLRSSFDVGLALLRDGERALPPPVRTPVGPTIVLDRGVLSNWLAFTGRYREALAVGATFLAALADGDQPERDNAVQVGLAHTHAALGHPDAARRAFTAAREGNVAHIVGLMYWVELLLVIIPYRADAIAERNRLAAEAARAWERARGTITDTPHDNPADLLPALVEGRWAEAQRLARSTSTNAVGGYAQGAIVMLGVLARHQGAPEVAWARVRELLPAGPGTEPGDCYFHYGIVLQALAADLALDAGDLATAEQWIVAHGRWLAFSGAVLWQADHQRLRARLAAASGDLATAHQHAEQALVHASEPRQPLALLAAHRTLGELATDTRAFAEATVHLDAALALAEACAAAYERALTLLSLADLRAAERQTEAATRTLAEARTILEPLEARLALARVEALAARLAAPAPPAIIALPFGLTARETEVLCLVAEGLTNAEVAARLFLTSRTVNAHLTTIYTKLNVTTRTAASRVAAAHGLC